MLTMTGATKSFDRRRVLDGLDLVVGAGESVCLIGANGSGKTTTLRCIVGLSQVDSGRIVIGGVDVLREPVRARSRLSYLPQKAVFPPTLTILETLRVVARLRGIASDAVDRELESCGLAALANRNVCHLSGGERQRLAMAVAFLPAVDLYLFDEASASLDPAASRILVQRARDLRRQGRTLLFTTHVPADVRHLATRVLVLRNGRIESDVSGAFELRRYERILGREIWGDDDETSNRFDPDDARIDPRGANDDELRGRRAIPGAGAARSR